ncbi:MAG: cyclodeaminase/cyclohydrolase family protein [Candidatus Omnitrophica bacterium]|nr:cyclodeaminase/cyclohydrolase family protein [Candidatus Omnitrophota bacterium]
MKLETFLNELSSNKPSPGGGSAAALTAATGVALLEMVARINRKRHPATGASRRIEALRRLREKAVRLITQDSRAFKKVAKHLKGDKNNPHYQQALFEASKTPFEICELAAQALEIGVHEISRTSRWLMSDLAEGGVLLEAAFVGGRMNVEINLKSITDIKAGAVLQRRLDQMEKRMEQCQARLKS